MKWVWVLLLIFLVSCQAQTQPDQNTIINDAPQIVKPITNLNDTSLSASDIYEKYKNSVYFVRSECFYNYKYPDFFLRSWVYPQWGWRIDLAIKKTTKQNNADTQEWVITNRTNSTKIYGTTFLMGDKLYTNAHVVECEKQNQQIVQAFELIDLSGLDVNALGEKFYDDQTGFEEFREAKDTVLWNVNITIAEHFYSKANFTLTKHEIQIYQPYDKYISKHLASLQKEGKKWPSDDYAILDMQTNAQPLEKGKSSDLIVGDTLYVLGFNSLIDFQKPEKHNYSMTNSPIITKGVFGGMMLSNDDVAYGVLDAAVAPGTSGSPVINDHGQVVGILTATSTSGDIGFFYPIESITLK